MRIFAPIPASHPELMYIQTVFSRGSRKYAIDCFYKAVQENPSDVVCLNALAEALRIVGRNRDALSYFEKSFALNSTNINSIVGLCKCLAKEGDLDRAEKILRQGHNDNPTNLFVIHTLSSICAQMQEFDKAEQLLKEALKSHEGDAHTIYKLGVILAMEATGLHQWDAHKFNLRIKDKLIEAQKRLTEARLLDHNDTDTLHTLARVYALQLKLGYDSTIFLDAVSVLKTSIEKNRHNPTPYKILGLLYLSRERFTEFNALMETAPQRDDGKACIPLLKVIAKGAFLQKLTSYALDIAHLALQDEKKSNMRMPSLGMARIFMACVDNQNDPSLSWVRNVIIASYGNSVLQNLQTEAATLRRSPESITVLDTDFYTDLYIVLDQRVQRPIGVQTTRFPRPGLIVA